MCEELKIALSSPIHSEEKYHYSSLVPLLHKQTNEQTIIYPYQMQTSSPSSLPTFTPSGLSSPTPQPQQQKQRFNTPLHLQRRKNIVFRSGISTTVHSSSSSADDRKLQQQQKSLGEQLADCRRGVIRESQRVETPSWIHAVDDLIGPDRSNNINDESTNGKDLRRFASTPNPTTTSKNSPFPSSGSRPQSSMAFGSSSSPAAGGAIDTSYVDTYGKMFKQSKLELQEHLKKEEEERDRRAHQLFSDNDDDEVGGESRNNNNGVVNSPLLIEITASPSSVDNNTKSKKQTTLRTFSESLQRDQTFRETEVRNKFMNKYSKGSNSGHQSLLDSSSGSFSVTKTKSKQNLAIQNEAKELFSVNSGSSFSPPPAIDVRFATSSNDISPVPNSNHDFVTPQQQQQNYSSQQQKRASAISFKLNTTHHDENVTTDDHHQLSIHNNNNNTSSLSNSFNSAENQHPSSINRSSSGLMNTSVLSTASSQLNHNNTADSSSSTTSNNNKSSNNVLWTPQAIEREDLRDLRKRKQHVFLNNTNNNNNASSLLQLQQQSLSATQMYHQSPFGAPRENNIDLTSSPQMQKWMRNVLNVAHAQQLQRENPSSPSSVHDLLNETNANSEEAEDFSGVASGFAAALLSNNSSFANTGGANPLAFLSSSSSLRATTRSSTSNSGPTTTDSSMQQRTIMDKVMAKRAFSQDQGVMMMNSASNRNNIEATIDDDTPSQSSHQQTPTAWTPGTDGYLELPELRHSESPADHPLVTMESITTQIGNDDDDENKTAQYNESRTKTERFQDVMNNNNSKGGSDDDDDDEDDYDDNNDDLVNTGNNNSPGSSKRRVTLLDDVQMMQTVTFDDTQNGYNDDDDQKAARKFFAEEEDDDDEGLDGTTQVAYALNPELRKLPPFEVLLQKFIDCKEKCRRHGVGTQKTVNSYDPLKLSKLDHASSPALCDASGRPVDPPISVAAVALSRFVTDESIVDAPSRVGGEGESVTREVEAEIIKWFRPWRKEFATARTLRNSEIIASMPVSSLRDLKEQREMARKIADCGQNSRKKDLVFKQQQIIQKLQQQASSAAASEEMKEKAKTRARKTMTLMFDPMCEVLRDLWKHFHVPFVDRAQFEDWNMRSVSSLNLWVISREISLYQGVKGSATDMLIRLINSRKSIVDRLTEVAKHPIFARAEHAWFALESYYAATIRGDRSPPRLRSNGQMMKEYGIDDSITLEQLGLEFLGLVLALRRISSDVISALVLSNSLPYSGPRIKLRDLEDHYLWGMRSDLIKQIGETPLMRLLSHQHPLEKRKRPVTKNLSYWDRVIEATTQLFRGKAIPLSHDNVFILPEAAHHRLSSEAHEAVRALVDKRHREWRAQARAQEKMEKERDEALKSGSNPFGSFTMGRSVTPISAAGSISASSGTGGLRSKSVSFQQQGDNASSASGKLDISQIKEQHDKIQMMVNMNKTKNTSIVPETEDSLMMLQQQNAQQEIDVELLEKANNLLRGDAASMPQKGSVDLFVSSSSPTKQQKQKHEKKQHTNDQEQDRPTTAKASSASLGQFKPLFGKSEPRGLTRRQKVVASSAATAGSSSSSLEQDNNNKNLQRSNSINHNNNLPRTRSLSVTSLTSGVGDDANKNDNSTLRIAGAEGVEISVRAVQKALELHQLDPLEEREREKEMTIEAILRSQAPNFLTKTEKCRLVVIKNGESGLRKEFVVEVPLKVSRDKQNLSRRQLRLFANATKQVADNLATHPTYKIEWLSCEEDDEQTSKPREEYFEMMERAKIQKERQEVRMNRAKATMVLSGSGEVVEVPPYQYPEEVLASSGNDNAKPPEVEALSRLSPLEEFVLRLRRSLDPELLRKTLIINNTDVCDEKVRAVLNVTLPPTFSQFTNKSSKNASGGGGSPSQQSGSSKGVGGGSSGLLTNARARKHPEEIAEYVQSPVFEFTKDTKNMTFRPVAGETVLGLNSLEDSLEKFVSLSRERLLRTACKKVARGCKRKLTGTIFGSLKDILQRDREERERALAAADDDDTGEEGFVEWLIQHGTIDPSKANALRDAFSSAWDEAGKFNMENLPGVDEARHQHFINYVLGNTIGGGQNNNTNNNDSGSNAVRENEDHNETDEIWRAPKVSGAQAELLSKDQLQQKIVAHDMEVKSNWPRHLVPSKKGDTFLFSS